MGKRAQEAEGMQAIMEHYAIAYEEHRNSIWIFHESNSRNDPPETLRKEYSKLLCKACELFDPLEAIKIGLSPEIKIPSPLRKRDIFSSGDGRVVVSSACRATLESVPGLTAHFFPLPGDVGFSVMLPAEKFLSITKVVVNGSMGKDVLRAEGPKCKVCDRFPFMMLSLPIVKFKSKIPFGGVVLDGGPLHGNRETWFASDAVRLAVKKAKLKGWIFRSLPSLERA